MEDFSGLMDRNMSKTFYPDNLFENTKEMILYSLEVINNYFPSYITDLLESILINKDLNKFKEYI